MTPESAASSLSQLSPLINGSISFVILVFGAIGAYFALRKKAAPEQQPQESQWFYLSELTHETRNLRQAIETLANRQENMAGRQSDIAAKQGEIAGKVDSILHDVQILLGWKTI
jgi:hypothetical protein